jgi:hypothetical protein
VHFHRRVNGTSRGHVTGVSGCRCNCSESRVGPKKEDKHGCYVKNRTPMRGPSPWASCENAMIVKGYRESKEVVLCAASYPSMRVTFAVHECTRHRDTRRRNLEAMEAIAWNACRADRSVPPALRSRLRARKGAIRLTSRSFSIRTTVKQNQ